MSRFSITISIFIFGLLSLNATAKDFYKWTDENGVTHYGDVPAKNAKDAHKIKTYTGAGKPANYKAAPTKAEQAKESLTATKEPQKNPSVCKNAKSNLKILEENARVKTKNESGEMVILGEDEKQAKIKEAQKLIKKHC